MCGRYYRRSDKQKLAEHFRVSNDLTSLVLPDADYNVAPTTMQPVIREARDTKDRELVLMRWGLIPFFSKSLADVKGISTINARAETIATSGTYREPFNVAAASSLRTASMSGQSPPLPPTVTAPRSRLKKRPPFSGQGTNERTKLNPRARLRTAST
jgi:SOS response associated peptidase (SRAP)